MAFPWGLIVFGIGILYGWLMPGRQAKLRLFVTGALIGLIASLAFALLGYFTGQNPLGLSSNPIGFLVAFVIMTLVFVLGVWIGDLIEGAIQGRRRTA